MHRTGPTRRLWNWRGRRRGSAAMQSA
jgi:hypothetical protein